MSHSLSTRRVSAVSYKTKQFIGMNLYIQTIPTLKLMSQKQKVMFTRHYRWSSRQSYIYYEITLLSPRNYDVWGMSIAIPYWWLVNTQVWIVLLIGWDHIPTPHAARPIRSPTQICVVNVIRMEFQRSFLRLDFEGKPVGASRNVVCFLRLVENHSNTKQYYLKRAIVITSINHHHYRIHHPLYH